VSFIWPQMLLATALVPLGAWLYVAIGRRRRGKLTEAFGATPEAPSPVGRAMRVGRRVPAALMIAGLLVTTVALARPQAVVALPQEEGIVVLVFDVSGSMGAKDISPTRMDAAKAAAKDFVAHQPPTVSIGVVAFSDGGVSVQNPTTDQGQVLSAINRLAPQKGTSLASGISAALDAIAIAEAGPYANDYYTNRTPAPTATPTPVPAGTHTSAVIVLLTDGENNERPDPLAAAQAAADRGVRIFTVGIGSPGGADLNVGGFIVHTTLDAAELQQIAEMTDGAYFAASDAQQLQSIYGNLDPELVAKPELTELTAIFAGAGALLLLAAGLTSLAWLGRLP
jgi:Ca-activated chloride channel family protein